MEGSACTSKEKHVDHPLLSSGRAEYNIVLCSFNNNDKSPLRQIQMLREKVFQKGERKPSLF